MADEENVDYSPELNQIINENYANIKAELSVWRRGIQQCDKTAFCTVLLGI